MAANQSFRDAMYEQYVSGHQGAIAEDRSQASFASQILPHLPSDRDVSVFEVGCGQGQVIRMIARQGYRDVSGIDLSAEQIALARSLGTERADVGDLFVAAEDRRDRYDVVIAMDVVEHFDRADAQRVFQALSDLLRPGGRLILRTPNGSSPYSGRLLFGDLTHGTIYTNTSIDQVGFLTGFDGFRCHPAPPVGTSLKARIRMVLWPVIAAIMTVPLIVETGQLRGHIVTQNLLAVGDKRR